MRPCQIGRDGYLDDARVQNGIVARWLRSAAAGAACFTAGAGITWWSGAGATGTSTKTLRDTVESHVLHPHDSTTAIVELTSDALRTIRVLKLIENGADEGSEEASEGLEHIKDAITR